MKNSKIFILFALFGLMACEPGSNQETETAAEETQVDEATPENQTVREITVDKYPMTPEEIEANQTISQTKEQWFSNAELNETLLFDMQKTNKAYHFKSGNIPAGFPDLVYLHNPAESVGEGYEVFSAEKRQAFLSDFATKGAQAPAEKFVTQQGIKLGTEKSQLIALYGEPKSSEKTGEVEILKWAFAGDGYGDMEVDSKETAVAKDSFGFEVTAFIENGKLVAQILEDFYP